MSSTMGQIIKDLRKKSGFTQEELAERLGVTYQAVSKWENNTGMPDISQVVPLASIFGVSTDMLFGIADTTENEEAWKIVQHANSLEKYGEIETYLNAYDALLNGLKKYPNNLIIMINCMNLGISLSLAENGWIYAKERAKEIASETIRQANFVIANSKNITDILSARQILVFLYCNQGKFDLATSEARNFPPRADLTLYSNMAIVNEYMNNNERTATYLCSNIDYTLQALENDIARLGKAYYNDGKYTDAIAVYETFFEIMSAIFKNETPLPYHDFDSGDCYLLLAEAYLAIGETSQAMNAVEKSVMYYIDLYNTYEGNKIIHRSNIKSPVVRGTELITSLPKEIIKKKLFYKLSKNEIQTLKQETRFLELLDIVNNLS
ncbi:MAG: helix-turn-helix domain-containing protein [Clostridia bacterium]|nr:helix-turn-helix domain-containing protein [Clostridia bacterium]